MSDYDDDRRRRRENLMEQRLRKARGEEVDEDLGAYDPYDDDDAPRGLGGGLAGPRGGYGPPRGGYGGGGCAQSVLYLVLGGLLALLIGLFFVDRALGGLGELFRPPAIAEILATPTPEIISGAAVVQRVQQLSRLETSSYTIQTVIEVNQAQGNPIFDFFAGDALLLIAHGTVVAGVDLGDVTAEDVTVSPDGRVITLRLPPAEVFDVSLDNGRTRVYSRNRGIFAPDNVNLETLARQEAEAQILRAACEDGVLSKATLQAEEAMRQFLGLVDDAEIVVLPAAPGACLPAATPAATPVPSP